MLSTYVYPVGLVLIPLTLGISILRYRLWDIDILINRTLVYGTLTTCVVALYVLVVVGLGALLQSSGNLLISLLATGLVAVLFQPLRESLQQAVNRLMYGERDTPYRVISRLGQRLEATLAPNEVLPTIVETVAQALKLPYVTITLKQESEFVRAASYGIARESLIHLPLVYQNEQMGELLLAPRASGETFTPADRALLDDLARQTGVAAHAVRLTAELQRLTGELQASRTQLVTMREEERRRLRRDLHDGLGSALTSMTFQLDASYNLLDRDPQAVKTLLKDLKLQTQASIADIRRLVYNLRPPILDEWGLVAAVREQVAQYQLNNVRVTVDAPESLPALPAAVEVAAYRIALESLANVFRHANASTCAICLALCEDALTVEVRDDGGGLPSSFHAGVGINAMRERAAELGGSCIVETITNGGTRGLAQLHRRRSDDLCRTSLRVSCWSMTTQSFATVCGVAGFVTDITVVGEASGGEEAIIQAAELQPDIILMDLYMPGLNGIEATRRIVQSHPHIGILVLTMLEDDASVFAAMRAGARGYLLRGS